MGQTQSSVSTVGYERAAWHVEGGRNPTQDMAGDPITRRLVPRVDVFDLSSRSLHAPGSLVDGHPTYSGDSRSLLSVQAYIDQQLMMPLASGHTLDHAAICGLDGGVWAQSASFPGLGDEECANLLKGFEDIGILGEKGVTIGGNKFMLIASDVEEGVVRAKNGPSGVVIKKTVSGLVIGMHGSNVTTGECSLVVEKLADYLRDQGI